MGKLDELTRALRDSNKLWREGEPRSALRLLDKSIEEAIRQNKNEWLQVLCRHAARISESINDFPLASGRQERNHQNEEHLLWKQVPLEKPLRAPTWIEGALFFVYP